MGFKPTFISVRIEQVGFHRWLDAPEHRAYLRSYHRHKFFITAGVEVIADDREIEFHDFQDFIESCAERLFYKPSSYSCETYARSICAAIAREFNRPCFAEVWEDNEVGAKVEWSPSV